MTERRYAVSQEQAKHSLGIYGLTKEEVYGAWEVLKKDAKKL